MKCVGILALALLLEQNQLFAQVPSVNSLTATGFEPAKSTVVTLRGDNLGRATELWTSFSAHAFLEPASAEAASNETRFRLYLPGGFSRGIGAVRGGTPSGASNLQLLMLDDLPVVSEFASNRNLRTAQELKLPVAVDGLGEELGFDYFKVDMQKGARLSVEAVAHRMGSPFDPVLRLLNTEGRELVYCDDAPGLQGDAKFTYQFPDGGTYFIELRDTRYQGGPRFRYHLRAGDFALEPIPFLPVVSPEGEPGEAVPDVTIPESEPNNALADATSIRLPCRITGGFGKAKDKDFYRFEAGDGDRFVFAGRSRSIGFPCDLLMQILSADGKTVAEANVTGPNDASLTNTFTEARSYYLIVEELNRNGGAELNYRIDISRQLPGFALNIDSDKIDAAPGAKFDLKVTCARRDYDGPVTLRLAGLKGSFEVSNNVIAAKSNSTDLKVSVPMNLPAGRVLHFSVVGEAKIGERVVKERASTMAALRRLFPLMLYPSEELDGLIALGIARPAP